MLAGIRLWFSRTGMFTIGLLIAATLATVHRSQATVRVKPAAVIRVWSVGSPFSASVPQTTVPGDLQHQAEQLGYAIAVQNFHAAGFASTLHEALATHTEPEFITFNNLGVLIGVNGPTGRYAGVLEADPELAESLQLVHEKMESIQLRGWVLFLRSAPNADAARALLMQPPQCQARVGGPDQSLSDGLKDALKAANAAAWSYLACDLPSLTAQSDNSRLSHKCFLANVSMQLDAVTSCGVLGNDALAIVPLVGTFNSRATTPPPSRQADPYGHWLTYNAIGQQTLLVILRKQDSAWRVLAITDDPVDTNPSIRPTYISLQRLSRLLTNEPGDVSLPSAALLTTPDGAKLRRLSQNAFDDFEWSPGTSPDVVAQVAEFVINNPAGPREDTRLFFLLGHENHLSSGFLIGLGGRWRVWSISRAGGVSLTESRRYTQVFARP